MKPIAGTRDASFLSADGIDRLLFQELNSSPTLIRGLPDRWMKSPAAVKTKERIKKLMSRFFQNGGVGMITSSSLCRTVPVWVDVCQEMHVEPRFVVMTRHPWETERSMNSSSDGMTKKGLLVWLNCIREMIAATHTFRRSFVTLDQLLADPVSALFRIGSELDLGITEKIGAGYLDILNVIQPERRHYHLGNSTEEDRRGYAPFVQIYNGLRTDMGSALVSGSISRSAESLQDIENYFFSHRMPHADTPNPDSAGSLMDIFLETIGLYEAQESALNLEKRKIGQIAISETPMFSVIDIPVGETESRSEQVFLLSEEWQKISVPLPSAHCIRNRPIRFAPLNVKGMVQISAVQLVNRATAEPVWSVNCAKDFHRIVCHGSVVRLSDTDNLILLTTAKDAILEIPCLFEVPNCPLALEIWINVSENQTMSHLFFASHSIYDDRLTVRTIHHLSCSGGTVMSKCLAVMNDVVLLSEIHPLRYDYVFFNDPFQQFQANYPRLRYTSTQELKNIFYDRISWIAEKCVIEKKNLIIRDHTHSDFLMHGWSESPSLRQFLSEKYHIKPVVTFRNPIDSYLALKANPNFETDVGSFETYCQRVIHFLDTYAGTPVFLYEDFVENPDGVLKNICAEYDIQFDPCYREKFHLITLTGDSGRGKHYKEIERLDRRAFVDDFKKEVMESPGFDMISKRYPCYSSI